MSDTLADRYGTPGRTTRVVIRVLVVLLAAAGLVWLGWAAYTNSTPAIAGAVTGYDVRSAHEVRVTLQVHVRRQHTRGSCDVRVYAMDHSVIGELAVPVRPGPLDFTREVSIRTERTANSVELIMCAASGTS